MIPSFLPNGQLPPGIHGANWCEVARHFAWAPCRRALLEKVRPACFGFQKAGATSLYLAGSFVSRKRCPEDIDILWDPAGVDVTMICPLLVAFSPDARRRQKQRFGAEFIPTTLVRNGPPFLDFFQTVTETGAPRGIVRLDLRRSFCPEGARAKGKGTGWPHLFP